MGDLLLPNPYERDIIADIMGETMRPGGFRLTDIGVQYCGLQPEDTVLDLGCGLGATVHHLCEKYHIRAMGIDSSEKMIRDAKNRYGTGFFIQADGEKLPFNENTFHCVFAECTLSLMNCPDIVMYEVNRVLIEDGWLVISDMYAKNPEALTELDNYPAGGCLRGLFDLEHLAERLVRAGFSVVCTEDHSQYLAELIMKIGFSDGSLCAFWQAAVGGNMSGEAYYQTIKRCKPGYFLMVARKRGDIT